MAVAVDHGRRGRATLHPRWIAHVDALDLAPVDATDWLGAFAADEEIDRRLLVSTVVALVAVLATAGPLSAIVPPPGANAGRRRGGAAELVDDPVLAKVRALLAQAESTTFEAEATAFTAKAQELMARHAIDAAVVWAGTDHDERVVRSVAGQLGAWWRRRRGMGPRSAGRRPRRAACRRRRPWPRRAGRSMSPA